MMMPANFSAVAENDMTYVVGGSLVDVLAPVMTKDNWQNVSANVIKIVGNSFLKTHGNNVLNTLFSGEYVPGSVIRGAFQNIGNAYETGYHALDNNGSWGLGLGVLNAGMQVLAGLSAIYTLGSGSVGLDYKGADSLPIPRPQH